jgi:hypothetical protein
MTPIYDHQDNLVGFIERGEQGGWFAYFRPDYDNPESEETEAFFARKRHAERWVRQQYTACQREAAFARLSDAEKDTLDWLYTLTPKEQRHEAANDPSAFCRLVERANRCHALHPSAVRVARQKLEAAARVSRAGCGALLAL